MTESQATVERNDTRNRYEISYDGRPAGFAEYEQQGDRTVFVHTEIDDAFSGKGLGSVLAAHALDDTARRGNTIVAECPFIKSYLDKHPEYRT
jgi:predicted GNAT family acetyltransferase